MITVPIPTPIFSQRPWHSRLSQRMKQFPWVLAEEALFSKSCGTFVHPGSGVTCISTARPENQC